MDYLLDVNLLHTLGVWTVKEKLLPLVIFVCWSRHDVTVSWITASSRRQVTCPVKDSSCRHCSISFLQVFFSFTFQNDITRNLLQDSLVGGGTTLRENFCSEAALKVKHVGMYRSLPECKLEELECVHRWRHLSMMSW